MTTAPSKEKEQTKKRKDEDNIFTDMIYNIIVYLPVLIISWIADKFDWS